MPHMPRQQCVRTFVGYPICSSWQQSHEKGLNLACLPLLVLLHAAVTSMHITPPPATKHNTHANRMGGWLVGVQCFLCGRGATYMLYMLQLTRVYR
jgi:hypothetical protein